MQINLRSLLLTGAVLLLIPALVYGQPDKITVTGTVTDAETGEPMSFSNVAAFNPADSSLVTGVITDGVGNFTLKLPAGSYYVEVTFVSYQPLRKNFSLQAGQAPLNLGNLALQPGTKVLEAVTVEAEKQQVQYQLDKKVFNLGEDPTTVGGDVANALNNLPGIVVDPEGGVQLRGSGDVRILVNGKESALVYGEDALQNIPASLIERVEVITNPSARYDAEGTGGIINLILKENQQRGFNGSVEVSGGDPAEHQATVNANLRQGKWNFFGTNAYRYRNIPGYAINSAVRDLSGGGVLRNREDQTWQRYGWGNTTRLGAEFSPNKNHSITASGLFGYSDSFWDTDVEYREGTGDGPLDEGFDRFVEEVEPETELEGQLTYVYTLGDDHDLTLDVRYTDGEEQEIADILQQNLDANGEMESITLQRSDNTEAFENITAQGDYIRPLGNNSQLETGARLTYRKIENIFLVEEFNDASNQWEVFQGQDDDYTYTETVYAYYASYGKEWERISMQTGLRLEVTDLLTELESTGERNNRKFTNLFPSAFFNYKLKPETSLQVSYSRRIRRPNFWLLAPFLNFVNPQFLRTGNPNINPEFTHSVEGGILHNGKKNTIGASLFLRRTDDAIQRLERVGEDGVTISSPENIAQETAYGVELTYTSDLTDWWNLSGDVNFFYNTIDGSNVENAQEEENFTSTGNITSRFKLPGKVNFQVNGRYRGPSVTAQGRRESIIFADAGLTKDLWSEKATVAFRISDVFNSRIWESFSSGPGFEVESERQWRGRQWIISFTYRINKRKERERRSEDYEEFD